MGWKGTLRSINAAANRAAREAEKQRKYNQKQQELANARTAVKSFHEYLDHITGLHKNHFLKCRKGWNASSAVKPTEPINRKSYENQARLSLENYQPGFFIKLFGLANKKRENLKSKLEAAVQRDEEIYNDQFRVYKKNLEKWEVNYALKSATPLERGKAYFKILEKENQFSKIEDLGTNISISLEDTGDFVVTIGVCSAEVIPSEKYSLRQSGTLSTKKMPKGEFNELYQDHVCSCVFRIALEIFSLIPIEKVLVHATDNLLNPKTGHLEEQTLLSVLIMRDTIEKLKLDGIDPSDAMANFVHNMRFTKTKGFTPVDKL